MKRLGLSVIGAALFAHAAQAQAPKPYAGEWRLAFATESRSGEPNLKPSPWLTFTATVVQLDSTVGGVMRSGDGPNGQFGCKLLEGACKAGRMRLSWDEQDWQVFEFAFDAGSTTKGTGRAEIRFPDGSVHKYSFVLTRP